MMRIAALSLLFASVSASATGPAGIPQNCQAPLAHDLEMENIPYLLYLGPNAARITKIEPLPSPGAYQYAPNLYRIVCSVSVHWSNGTIDRGYVFSVWEDQYGSIRGSYGRSY